MYIYIYICTIVILILQNSASLYCIVEKDDHSAELDILADGDIFIINGIWTCLEVNR